MNMKLLGRTTPPTNKVETFHLSIDDAKVLIAIIPGSRAFRVTKPYTADNIDQRLKRLAYRRQLHNARRTHLDDEIVSIAFELVCKESGTVIAPRIA